MIALDSDKQYEILSLSEMIETYGQDIVSDILESFKSVHDSATESFLKEKAIDMEIRDLSGHIWQSRRRIQESSATSPSASNA